MSDAPAARSEEALSALLHESRHFDPPPGFAAQANAQPAVYDEAAADRLAWWAQQAQTLSWDRPFDSVLEWNLPFARWFVGGRLNASVNCVDRHVAAGYGDKVAYYWVGEPEGDARTITYGDLKEMVCRAANALAAVSYTHLLMLTLQDPLYQNWDQDKTAIEDHYEQQEPALVAAELSRCLLYTSRLLEEVR